MLAPFCDTASLPHILIRYYTVKDEAAEDALVPFSQPGIVTIPLGFVTLVAVPLATQQKD